MRGGDAGVHHVDAAGGDAAELQRVLHRVRDGDEAGDARAILEPSLGDEGDASGDHERDVALADERPHGEGVRACVVGVHDVRSPGANEGVQATRRGEVPVGAHAHATGREAGATQPMQQRRVAGGDDQGLVTGVTLAAR